MKPLTTQDLRPNLIKKEGKEWAEGVVFAINAINDIYGNGCLHPKMIGDCVLLKLNMLRRKKPRTNISYEEAIQRVVAHTTNSKYTVQKRKSRR